MGVINVVLRQSGVYVKWIFRFDPIALLKNESIMLCVCFFREFFIQNAFYHTLIQYDNYNMF